MSEIYIHGIGAALGDIVEQNDATTLGQSEGECQRIVAKVGVYSRPIAGANQFTSDLARAAVMDMLENTSIKPDEVGALLVCTQTPDHLIPGVSSRLHGQLGFPIDCLAFDINQGCSGFVIGTQVMTSWLRTSNGRGVLVNADTYSKLIRPDDLTTRMLFGDAACTQRNPVDCAS